MKGKNLETKTNFVAVFLKRHNSHFSFFKTTTNKYHPSLSFSYQNSTAE